MNYEHSDEHPLDIACPYFPPEEQTWLQGELSQILNGRLSMGPRVARFERDFAAYCGVRHGIAYSSCTAALEAALTALDVRPGDEVLVPAETFVATGMAVLLLGARPVFTEVTPETFGMDFDDAGARLSDRTRGAVVVHFGGAVDPRLMEFAARMRADGRFVIEDAAHAHGAELNGRRAGSFGDAACFSFYPTKIMTTGEGGMVTTARDGVAAAVRSLQNRGRDLDADEERYVLPGRNNRFTEIAAAMGLSQLRSLPGFLTRRRRVARLYDEAFRDSEYFQPVLPMSGSMPSYWRYVLVPKISLDRSVLKQALAADRITIDWAYDPPVHLQPVFRRLLKTREGMLPRAEALLRRHICLPIHARLRDIDVEYIVDRLLHHTRRLASTVHAGS
jgi:perosamine synthetase